MIVERPTYDRTLLNLRARGANVHPVELEQDGISTDGLAELLGRPVNPLLAHIIPNFQNPAGYTLSAPKRERLLELAGEHDFTIFEDDPYMSIRFAGEPLPTMLSQDGDGRVVYASSFSKTVCPGIRVGYLVGEPVIKQIQGLATNTYISPNMVPSRSSTSSAARARSTARSRPSRARCASASSCWRRRSSASCPRRASPAPGRLLHVGRAARGHGRRRTGPSTPPPTAASPSSRARTSCSRAARTRCASPTPA